MSSVSIDHIFNPEGFGGRDPQILGRGVVGVTEGVVDEL